MSKLLALSIIALSCGPGIHSKKSVAIESMSAQDHLAQAEEHRQEAQAHAQSYRDEIARRHSSIEACADSLEHAASKLDDRGVAHHYSRAMQTCIGCHAIFLRAPTQKTN